LNVEVKLRISQTVVVGLKIIIEYIEGTIVSDDSTQEFHIQSMASQNELKIPHQHFDSRHSFVNHHVINLLNKLIGHSHVNISVQSIVAPAIAAFSPRFLFDVTNLYNQNIHAAKPHKTAKLFQVLLCHGVIFLQLFSALSTTHATHHS
jgi:hypothetical protein